MDAPVTFGHGLHTCLGAPLARLDSRVVLEQMPERFPELPPAPGYRREPAPAWSWSAARLGSTACSI
nr:hypothetical protein [Streptomyces sp. A244]